MTRPRGARRLLRARVVRTVGSLTMAGLAVIAGGAAPLAACSRSASRRAPSSRPAELAPWSDVWVSGFRASFLGEDPRPRRSALEAALTNPMTAYSAVRLAGYGLGDRGWDRLPAWTPVSRPLTRDDLSAIASGAVPALPERPIWDGTMPRTDDEWRALGRRVFFEYPLRPEAAITRLANRPERLHGLGVDDLDGNYVGLVWFRHTDGIARAGITCATCHSAVEGGRVVAGRARRRLDYGALRVEAGIPEEERARYLSWGAGRADVLEQRSEVPIAISDLWGLRDLRVLTASATLRHDSPLALAIRQDTQFIQASSMSTRAPRVLVWALVTYLYSLAPPPRAEPRATDWRRGHALFEEHCTECHRGSTGSGPPVRVERVGTDPELALSSARGAGVYRPAPLIDVARAAPYLHHGVVPSLESLLDPARLVTTPGHPFGTRLDAIDRAALIHYLESR